MFDNGDILFYSAALEWKKESNIKNSIYQENCSEYDEEDYKNINKISDDSIVVCYNMY